MKARLFCLLVMSPNVVIVLCFPQNVELELRSRFNIFVTVSCTVHFQLQLIMNVSKVAGQEIQARNVDLVSG
jgi:hypothetical protein